MESKFLSLVGERIRALRKEKGYTQEYLAEKAGIHYTYISDIERAERNISLETLEKIIIALEIAPVEIFRFENLESSAIAQDKQNLIRSLQDLLHDRDIEETKLLIKIVKEMTTTYDLLKTSERN